MTIGIIAAPLTRESFAPFGEVIDPRGADSYFINAGMCERFHALARAQALGEGASVIINVFRAQPYSIPLALRMMERHPLGSQAFVPLSGGPFLVVVAQDAGDRPGLPHAFLATEGQGVNYPAGLWHGVLTPLDKSQDFLVVDRGGEGHNLDEHHFPEPYEVRLGRPA